MSTYISTPEEAKEYIGRYRYIYAFIFFTFFIFISRLWYLQVFSGAELREFSEKNHLKQIRTIAPRGLFLDRDGKVLVENLPGFEAILTPQYLKDIDIFSKTVGPILGIEPEKLSAKINKSRKQNGPFAPIKLKENLSREEVFHLKRIRLDLPGLDIQESILRHYPLEEDGAHVFGYVSEISKRQLPKLNAKYEGNLKYEMGDLIGKSGLEETLESYIRGETGVSFIQVDAHGRETTSQNLQIYGENIKNKPPAHGDNVVLTLDKDIQEAAYNAMLGLNRVGSVVALKSNGEVLAMLSTPAFNPNEFSTGISMSTWSNLINNPLKPLRNKSIQDHTSPGSTFKPFVAIAALQEKEINKDTLVHAPGVFQFGRRPYHDSNKQGYGYITIFEAIERSSNVFFYKMGIALGIEKIYNYTSLFGLGSLTGIELPQEIPGLLPNSEWKKEAIGEEWQPGENLSAAIGQGFINVTPIQMALAYNTIGNEGKLYKPFIVKKILDQEGKSLKEFEPTLVRDLTEKQSNGIQISPSTFKIVKEAMGRVVQGEHGTAKFWKIPGIKMGGKTGTSQVQGFTSDQIYVRCETRPMHMRHHGFFIAFAPLDNPEITVAVLTEHSCHGNVGSAPIVKAVMEAYFKKYHPEIELYPKKSHKKSQEEPIETLEGE